MYTPSKMQSPGFSPAAGQRVKTLVAAVGDANSPATYNGLPYYLLQAGRRRGIIDEGLALSVSGGIWKARRLAWNLLRPVQLERPGGYQYSSVFLRALWAPVRNRLAGTLILNCFQLYPDDIVTDAQVRKWFFIDQTLPQLFDVYGDRAHIGKRIYLEAMRREGAGYQAAEGVIANSRWAAASVVNDCGVPPERVHVVLQGAAFDMDAYQLWEQGEAEARARRSTGQSLLRLVFLGKDWQRKGLDRLLRGIACAQRQGFQGTLRVIGCPRESLPAELRNVAGVEWLGFVNKRADWQRFFRLIAECDVGCLLSRAEAGGLGLCEYHALGLAVLGTAAGGAPEQMLPEASVAVPVDAGDEQIAELLLKFEREPDLLSGMRERAWQNRHRVTWDESIRQMLQFWPYRSAATEPASQTRK
jgi:glycosyltransferase involved in cell wall biosynthesis